MPLVPPLYDAGYPSEHQPNSLPLTSARLAP
jgi:hypothetical protein